MDNAPSPCIEKPIFHIENNKKEDNEDIKNIDLIEKKEFKIEYKNKLYDIIICKTKNKKFLILQCYEQDNKYNKFEVHLKFDDLIKLSKAFKVCESIDDAYKIILNKFNEKKVFIQESKDFKTKIIYFSLTNIISGEEQKIEIEIKNNNDESYIINEFGEKYNKLEESVNRLKKENEIINNKLKCYEQYKINMENKIKDFQEEMKNIKAENLNLKKDIELLKSLLNENKNFNNNKQIITPKENKNVDPLKLTMRNEVSEKAYCSCVIDSTFTVFQSRTNKKILIVYSCKNNSLKCDDLQILKNIKTIEKAHENNIVSIKYFNDTMNNRDLILSISGFDKVIKIWNASNWECLTKLISYKKDNYNFLALACLLFSEEDKNIYIISSSNSEYDDMKIFSFEGKEIGKIRNSKEDRSFFVDIYFDKKRKKKLYYFCK